MRTIKFILLFLVFGNVVLAQQDAQFTQYMYNTISVNPAYAGSRGALTFAGLARQQWMGIDGAPSTQSFYLNSPFINKNNGIGLSFVNDKIGPVNQTYCYADYAYHLRLSKNVRLAMGLKGGVNIFQSSQIATLKTTVDADPTFVNYTNRNTIAPNFGAGLYLYSEKFYVGLSAPKLLENKLGVSTDATGATNKISEVRHYFAIVGFILPVGENLKLKPTLQAKLSQNAPVSLDVTVEALYKDKVSFGLGYRHTDAISALIGFYFTPQFRAGFAYDYTLSELQKYNSGTIELMLQYDLFRKQDKLKSPRYF